MTLALALIFGFMVFMLIITKGHLLFINITSMIVIAAISFAIGYGIAVLVIGAIGPVLKILAIIAAVLIGLGLVGAILGKGDK